jgi:hypothetical protein
MNISRPQNYNKTSTLLCLKIFFVLFLGLLVGCVKVSVSCNVSKVDEIASAVADCKETPTMGIKKEF